MKNILKKISLLSLIIALAIIGSANTYAAGYRVISLSELPCPKLLYKLDILDNQGNIVTSSSWSNQVVNIPPHRYCVPEDMKQIGIPSTFDGSGTIKLTVQEVGEWGDFKSQRLQISNWPTPNSDGYLSCPDDTVNNVCPGHVNNDVVSYTLILDRWPSGTPWISDVSVKTEYSDSAMVSMKVHLSTN